MGPGIEPTTKLGPLVNEESRSKVAALVEDAVSHGATVLTGGKQPDQAVGVVFTAIIVTLVRLLENLIPGSIKSEFRGPAVAA